MNVFRSIVLPFALVLLCIHPFSARAQFYSYGQSPSDLKWKQIESGKFRIIYPEGLDSAAIHTWHTLNRYYDSNASQLGHFPKRVPIILHNQTVTSNGFVSWAPARSEFFTHPDVEGFSQDWLTQLSIHEYRHIIQISKMNKGITRAFTTLAGEMGIALAAAQLPFWFLEGDAVYAETSLTQTGRGRLPSFEMGIKSQLLSDHKPYSFSKSYLGSYRDFVPDYYSYGYQMVSWSRMHLGNDFWDGALDYTARNPWLINPVHFYLRKKAGMKNRELYYETMDELYHHWTTTASERTITDPHPLSKPGEKTYTSYRSPVFLDDGRILAIKSGFDHTERFVSLDKEGREQSLFIPGFLYSNRISVKNNRILWDEYIPGTRWSNQSWSVLKDFDIESGKARLLTLRTRYSSPAWSPSGDSIVAVETGLNNEFSLVLLSSLDGGVFRKIPSPGNLQLQDPFWIENSPNIAVISNGEEGKKIWLCRISDGTWTEILDAGPVNISRLYAEGNTIYFNAAFTGLDEIYSLSLSGGSILKLTSSRYGAFQPALSNGNMAFSFYTPQGYRVSAEKIPAGTLFHTAENRKITEQPYFRYFDDKTPDIPLHPAGKDSFSIRSYSKLLNLFNFHSWAPFWFDFTHPDIEKPDIQPGVSVLSQNLLSTAVTALGYSWSDGNHFLHTRFNYSGFLPVIDISHTYGGKAPLIESSQQSFTGSVPVNSRLNVRTYIPINLTAGRFITGIQPSLTLRSDRSVYYYPSERAYFSGLTYLDPRIYFYSFHRTSYRELQPRTGLFLDGYLTTTPFEDELIGSRSTLRSGFYLPGFARNHGLRLGFSWQSQETGRYVLQNSLPDPRGYELNPAEQLTAFTVDYVFPLAYPDLEISSLFFLKRIRAAVFTDFYRGKKVYTPTSTGLQVADADYLSYGAEIRFDYHLFRILFPVSSGARLVYRASEGTWMAEGIFSFDINAFR